MNSFTHFGREKKRVQKKIDFAPELLYKLGASGKTQKALAKELGCSPQLISREINKSVTNTNAYNGGKEENGKQQHDAGEI